MKALISLLGVCAVCLGLSGCMARIMDFTLLSTKNVNIPGERGARVQGEDIANIIIVIPTGQPNIKTAVDRAIENGHGDMLADAVISMKSWYIPYIFGQQGFVVEGTIVDTSKAPKTAVPTVAGTSATSVSVSVSVSASTSGAPPSVAVSSYQSPAAPAQEEPEAPRAARPAPLSQAQAEAELLP